MIVVVWSRGRDQSRTLLSVCQCRSRLSRWVVSGGSWWAVWAGQGDDAAVVHGRGPGIGVYRVAVVARGWGV